LDKLESREKRYWVADSQTSGLRLFVFPSGIKTFCLVRKIKGRSEKIKIGRFSDLSIEQARKQALKFNSIIALGGNPAEELREERIDITFKELYEFYYHQYASIHTKRPDENKKMLEFHIFPLIGNRKLLEITSEKIRKIHADIGKNRGKVTANRVLTLVNSVFNFGIKNGHFKHSNPCFGLTKFKEFSRDRFLSKVELKLFFASLTLETQFYQDFFSLLLYTAGRKSNVLGMRWSDIDLEIKRWRISESETKNQDVNIVYLSDICISILSRRKTENEKLDTSSDFVFPANSKDGHLKDPKKAFQRIKNRMKIQDFRMHDLRRTLASYMAITGASLPIIGKALNHKNPNSTAIYARLDKSPVLDAINTATSLIAS